MTHILLKSQNTVRYMESKWERNIGETLNLEGRLYKVAQILESKEQGLGIINNYIKIQNSIQNKIRRQEKKMERVWLLNTLMDSAKQLGIEEVDAVNTVKHFIF